ncbi:MAG: 16S rRNA (cytosine(1402)-N(4))-methyltransferase RsmH [Sphingomonadales bacterium]
MSGNDPALAHIPVMAAEVVEALAARDGAVFVDGTFGAGGYSRALLGTARCTVWGIDRDPLAVSIGARLEQDFPGRVTVIQGSFGEMDRLLQERGIDAVDGVALDLGVSSMQIDDATRGFSFRFDGPLDMRMGNAGRTAADIVNSEDEGELADIIYKFGEERASRRIAKAIVTARRASAIMRTSQLAQIVADALGARGRAQDIHPATRTFQALRIHVNDELGELARGLAAAERLLAPGGRLCVVSFHSLEDRIVKLFLRERSGGGPKGSRHRPAVPDAGGAEGGRPSTFKLLSRRVSKPGAPEIAANPRARSARLRAAVRTAAAPWPVQVAA